MKNTIRVLVESKRKFCGLTLNKALLLLLLLLLLVLLVLFTIVIITIIIIIIIIIIILFSGLTSLIRKSKTLSCRGGIYSEFKDKNSKF